MQGALPDLENGWAHCAQIWYAVRHRLVGWVPCKSHFGSSLHVRTCRVPLPDLRNGRVDCLQIWHTASDRLVGCRALSQLKVPSHPSARAGLTLSLARSSPKRRYTGYIYTVNTLKAQLYVGIWSLSVSVTPAHGAPPRYIMSASRTRRVGALLLGHPVIEACIQC